MGLAWNATLSVVLTGTIGTTPKSASRHDSNVHTVLSQTYTPPDPLLWIRRAAEQGHTKAQLALAELHFDGRDAPKDRALSEHWFLRAAKQGDAGPSRR